MNVVDHLLRYWNTVKYLRPVQIEHQIRKRVLHKEQRKLTPAVLQLKAPFAQKVSIVIPELDCNDQYVQRFHPEMLLKNNVRLLHESHKISNQWEIPEASHLWNYNLHYLEFLISLAVSYKETGDENCLGKWMEYIKNWMEHPAKDSMEPYTISLRIPNILICMELLEQETEGAGLRTEILDSIYGQYRFLTDNTELSLLANHYFENLKTIVICSLLFDEQDKFCEYFFRLKRQIREQILPDGVHFERSMMYHRIILEDILRIYLALKSAGHEEDAEGLAPVIRSMASAMENIEAGFDTVPLFNDAGNNVAKGKAPLLAAVKRICGYESVCRTDFPKAGYYRLDKGNGSVLFDCGEIGPSYMGGHSHCDCLSFELGVDGHKILSNSGTGQYQGTKREFFRSTRAHNTFMVDDREQSELWGEHRAARRISQVKAELEEGSITGQYRSYQGDLFKRRLEWNDNVFTIKDMVEVGDGHAHTMRQFFHLAPGCRYECEQDRVFIRDKTKRIAEMIFPAGVCRQVHKEGEMTWHAGDFGQYLHKEVLEVKTGFRHEVQTQIDIRINSQKGNQS